MGGFLWGKVRRIAPNRVVHKAPLFTLENIGIFARIQDVGRWSIAYRLLTMWFRNNAIIRISVTRHRSSPRKS
jgi:hypothetical protein